MSKSPSASGCVLWFTGLSGSGKSTQSAAVAARLRELGVPCEVLDGDEVRTHLSKGLSFSKEDRDTNVRRIGFVARLLARHGVIAITAAISPYREVREEIRREAAEHGVGFVEVFMRCPLEVLAERDVKGLYKRALAGELPNFTGVSDPYQEPLAPEVIVDSSQDSEAAGTTRILGKLADLGYLRSR